MATLVKCPTCKRPVEWAAESTYRPFCSDRCRLIDLGAWFGEKHRIPDESSSPQGESPADDESHANLPEES